MTTETGFTDVDHEFFHRELDAFLPDRIYDAHAHMWKRDWASFTLGADIQNVGIAEYDRAIAEIHGDRPTETLFLSFATPDHLDLIDEANAWTADQIEGRPPAGGTFLSRLNRIRSESAAVICLCRTHGSLTWRQ